MPVKVRSRLCRLFWRWCELVGECCVYAETGELPAADRRDLWDGRALDPGEVYIASGIEAIERFVAGQGGSPCR
jgi:hypothetical protein